MLGTIADRRTASAHAETLTGFKWITTASTGSRFGYEEALGYCVDPEAVRDKDGISAALLVVRAGRRRSRRRAGRSSTRSTTLARAHGVHVTDQLSASVSPTSRVIDATMAAPARHAAAQPGGSRTSSPSTTCSAGADGLPPTDGLRLHLDGGRPG